jgi:drug/metabolite transporter (DMT)-like permease
VGAALLFPSERRLLQQPRYLLSLAAVFLGTISIVLLRSSKDATTIGADREFLGFLLALASGLGFGMYGLAVRRSLNDVPAWLGFAVVSQYTAAFMLIVMFIASPAEWSAPISADSALIALLAASAVIGIWLAHFLYFYSIRHLGLATAAGVVQLQPFVVGLASLALYNERLSAAQWLSGGVAVSGAAGMLFVQWQHTRE